jgi:LmbE family N-acetylglucosaminyl deacetylase
MRCDSLYLSPHLDDAVLSCAARIHREASAGGRVVVATLFTHGREPLYERRRAEDARAVASLGASAVHLGLIDAPSRRAYYSSFRAIVLGTHPADGADEEEARHVLGSVLPTFGAESIYCPLGVGTHIDHRLTYRAAVAVVGMRGLTFYEDRPYVFVPGHLAMRLAELSLRGEVPPVEAGTYLRALREALYVRTYLADEERDECEAMLAHRLGEVAPSGSRVSSEVVTADRSEDAFDAIALYETQLADLYGDAEGLRRESRRYAATLGDAEHAERYWRVEE